MVPATRSGSRHRLPEAALFDMGGTVLVMRAGSMRKHTIAIYRTYGRIPDDVSDEEILRTIAGVRRLFEGLPEMDSRSEVYWNVVNTEILRRLVGDHHASSRARMVRKHFLGIESLQLSRTVRHMMRMLRQRGVRILVATNATREEAETRMSHFGLMKEIDGLHTSEEIGIRKPNPAYWERILTDEGFHRGTHFLHIGNSLHSDSGAAALPNGSVHIIDKFGRYSPHDADVHLNEQFSDTWAETVRGYISSGRVRFSKSRAELVARVLGNPQIAA